MTLSALQAAAYLHHLHLEASDAQKVAQFYGDALDMMFHALPDGTWVAQGPGRRMLFSPGQARKLVSAGFAVRDADDLKGLRDRAGKKGLSPKAADSYFFAPGAFSVTDPDGNVILFGLSKCEAPEPPRLRGPLQHLTLATRDVEAIERFYAGGLGFGVSDRVVSSTGKLMTCFMRGNHEHHNLACFLQERQGIDHHSYEAGEWDTIRDWSDRLAERNIELMWGPGRHGPGNNLFIFIEDPDKNWIEISAELEVIHDRPVREWPHAPRTLNLWGPAIMRAQG